MIHKAIDIEFHRGPRNCGKSIFVEKELSIYNNLLYIGTLPRFEIYLDSIQNHKDRRGNNWKIFEITFNFYQDIESIRKNIEMAPKKSACLLDGIWAWFFFQNRISTQILDPFHFADGIISLIKNTDTIWRLVDIQDNSCHPELEEIQDRIIKGLNITKIIQWQHE